jgi:cell division control protein 7
MATIRPRNPRSQFDIHHDRMDESLEEGNDESRAYLEEEEDNEEDEEEHEGAYSDSGESDATIDPAVQEDMDRFQDTFHGIKDRFRLINRIGEGNSSILR